MTSWSVERVAALNEHLVEAGERVAVAESLTGGLVVAALVQPAGASRVVVGAVVAYSTEIKATVLGVPEGLLAERGAVDADVALHMARGVRARMGATIGVATTGVAGPDPQDGCEVGTVFVAVVTDRTEIVREAHFEGSRDDIRSSTVDLALQLLGNSGLGE